MFWEVGIDFPVCAMLVTPRVQDTQNLDSPASWTMGNFRKVRITQKKSEPKSKIFLTCWLEAQVGSLDEKILGWKSRDSL